MSTPSQVVYFDNPANITQLQNLAGTTPNLPDINTMGRYLNYLNGTSGILCTKSTGTASNMTGAPTTNTDLNGIALKGLSVCIGNAFSGQQSIYSTGTRNSAGSLIDGDSICQQASSYKWIAGLAMCKMLEEGYFSLTESISKYVPQFTGTGYCILSATGTRNPNYVNAPDFSQYTGTFGRVALDTITIAQAMAMQIAWPYVGQLSFGQLNQSIWTSTTTNPDWNLLYANALAQQNWPLGYSLGATGACQLYTPATSYAITGAFINNLQVYNVTPGSAALRNFSYNNYMGDYSYCTGPFIDQMNTTINCIKAATIPLAWNPNIDYISQEGIYTPKAVYGEFSWSLMQAVMNNALKVKQGTPFFPATGTYPNLISYMRNKILAPCGITTSNSFFGFMEGIPAGAPMVDPSFRRSYVTSTGYYSAGVSPSYVAGGVNRIVFMSEYPDDGITKFQTGSYSITNDPIGPRFFSDFFCSNKSFANLLIMIINKGVYNGQRLITRSTWNYFINAISSPGVGSGDQQTGNYDNWGPAINWMLGFAKPSKEFAYIANLPDSLNTSGVNETTNTGGLQLSQGFGPNVIYWSGSGGTSFMADLDTGSYVICMSGQTTYGTTSNSLSATTQYQFVNQYV